MKCAFWRRWLAVLAAALAIGGAGCPESSGALRESERHRSYEGKGKTIVVVLDISGSMSSNDPDKVSVEGTHLLAALVEGGDNVGCAAFSSRAEVLAPIRTIRSVEDRKALVAEVSGVKRHGGTNFIAALRTARRMLEGVAAPAGASVIFMTDGAHNIGAEEEVYQEVAKFREKQWKIHALGYSEEGLTQLLSELATRTGGGYFTAIAPKDLLLAYVKIMSELEDVMIAQEIRPVRIWKDTSRLLYVVLKKERETRLASATHKGQPFDMDGAQAYHYPARGERSRSFDVLRIEKPGEGVWDGRVEGPYEVGLIIQDSPFEFSFAPGAPKREQVDGRPVEVTLLAQGPADALETLRKGSAVEAEVTAFEADEKRERPVAKPKLAAGALAGGKTLPFTGDFTPRLRTPGRPETHTVRAHLVFKDGEVSWTHDETVSYRLVPPPPVEIEVEPAEMDFGVLFTGDVSPEKEAVVRGSGNLSTNVAVEPSAAVVANPRALPDISGGAKARVKVAPEAPGPFQGSVLFRPAAAKDDAETATLRVKAKVVYLDAPSGVSLGDVEAGSTGSAPVKIEGEDPRIQLVPLAGPKGTSIPMKLSGSAKDQTLAAEVPATAPTGDYKGSIDVTVGGGTKRIPVNMRVTPAQAKLSGLPEKLAFEASKNGWTAEQAHEAKLEYNEPCAVAMTLTDLKPASGKGRPIRAGQQFQAALDGLDGGSLAPGAPAKLKAKVYVSADTQPGSYAGKVAVTVKSPDGRQTNKEIPVELTVTR